MKLRVFWGGKFRMYNDIDGIMADFTPAEIREASIDIIYHCSVVGEISSEKIASEIEFMEYEEKDKTGLELMYLMDNRVYETV